MSEVAVADHANVAGNNYDKYGTGNPIARRLMNGFLTAFDALSLRSGATTAYEFGCGEGHLAARLQGRGVAVRGSDLDGGIVAVANAASAQAGHGAPFAAKSLYDTRADEIDAELIVCCEVLEHLPDPDAALAVLAAQRADHWLLSVPREPVWRVLNMARGRYLRDWGNTPGHLQHWSAVGFRQLIERHFTVVAERRPLPWTMLLCSPRQR